MTKDEYLMGRDKEYPIDAEKRKNMCDLIIRINKFEKIYGFMVSVSSGYRPGKYNKAAGGSPNSAHLTCEAVDLVDREGKIKKFILDNLHILDDLDLYMEDPASTKTWCHLSIRKTASGRRVFKP